MPEPSGTGGAHVIDQACAMQYVSHPMGGGPPAVELVHVTKRFGTGANAVTAVAEVDLAIGDGEFFSLLGPSGSGKTTVLRMIAGFEHPTAGAILLKGADVTHTAPFQRDVNTVFQDYALFPHMNVQRNVEYGLKVKGVSKAERKRRAGEMLEVVRLSNLAHRKPSQMSGGQRQRVALARALVNHPAVLLLDEPLGALDLKLREEMQTELKSIQQQVRITFVFVTHDQGEALSMSTRVAVFSEGRIDQVGTPREIYEQPASAFVAGFVGTANLLDADTSQALLGTAAPHSVRPERIRFASDDEVADDHTALAEGTVADVQYLGATVRYRVALNGGPVVTVAAPSGAAGAPEPGDAVRLAWPRLAALALAPP
jgi:putative spermidine/putrescine transport system ATP-binding protein